MKRELSFYPPAEAVEHYNRRRVTRVHKWIGTHHKPIEIERTYGRSLKTRDHISQTTTYERSSEASRKRLDQTISKMVNKGQASIGLFENGYEVEL